PAPMKLAAAFGLARGALGGALLNRRALVGREHLEHLGTHVRFGQRERGTGGTHFVGRGIVHASALGRQRQRTPRLRLPLEQAAHLLAVRVDDPRYLILLRLGKVRAVEPGAARTEQAQAAGATGARKAGPPA